MKRTIIYSVMLAAAVVCGCRKPVSEPVGKGVLELNISSNGSYQIKTKATNSDVNEFVIDITRPSDGWSCNYPRFGSMPLQLDLGSGDYTITATSPYTLPAAFDQPVYSGSANFTIKAGETTAVGLVCTLANMKVSLVPSENFKKELSDYTVTVTNSSSWTASDVADFSLVWDKEAVDSGKEGYFSVAPLMVKVDGYRAVDNSECHAELAVSQVAARDHHVITLDARVTGQGTISISIDDSVNERDQSVYVDGWAEVPVDGGEQGGDEPGGDDPIDPPGPSTAPTMSWEANPEFAPTPIASEMDVNILINAPEKIKGFIVSVDSPVLSSVIAQMVGNTSYKYPDDGPYDMDLINDTTIMGVLGNVGVPVGEQLVGKESVLFSISTLVPLISMYPSESGTQHVFTLKVTDEKDQVLEKPIVFYTL